MGRPYERGKPPLGRRVRDSRATERIGDSVAPCALSRAEPLGIETRSLLLAATERDGPSLASRDEHAAAVRSLSRVGGGQSAGYIPKGYRVRLTVPLSRTCCRAFPYWRRMPSA